MTLPSVYASKERLNELFEYRDGKLYNKTNRTSTARKGMESGFKNPDGYRRVRVDGKLCQAHRLIYIMHWGDIPEGLCIDHINCIRDDNRIENLRVVTYQENTFNRTAKGYYFHKASQKWNARIMIGGVHKQLGYFDLEEDAAQAYQVAKNELHIIEER